MRSLPVVAILLLSTFSLAAIANSHIATIVKLENSSVVYVPGENNAGGFTHIKYLGSVYHIVPAVKGSKLDNGHILSTGPTSKAKVIFNNGDHLFVSENTQYKVEWKRELTETEKDPSVLSLVRGAVRGMIQKDGPRSGMKIKTQAAVMGIRGTDFYISENREELNVTVMRGEVELLNNKSNDKAVKVEAGQTLSTEDKEVKVTVITKEDLQEITKGSTILETKPDVKQEPNKELTELEKSATQVTLNDIKEYQPGLYKEILEKQSGNQMNSDLLAINTTKIMEEHAPSRPQGDLEAHSNSHDNFNFMKKK